MMMGYSVQALHCMRLGDRRTNIKPNYASRLTRSKCTPLLRPECRRLRCTHRLHSLALPHKISALLSSVAATTLLPLPFV